MAQTRWNGGARPVPIRDIIVTDATTREGIVAQITLDSTLRVTPFTRDAHLELTQRLQADTTMDNPEYAKRKRLNRSTYNVPAVLRFYEYDRTTQTLILPRGYWPRLHDHLHRLAIAHDVEDRRVTLLPVPFHSRIELRDYQIPAVEALIHEEEGILEAPCGAGKTECGLEIVARIGQPALWLAHTQDLAEQAIRRAAKIGLAAGEIGFIGGGRRRIGARLTVGLVQTLAGIDDPELLSSFGLVILDECHHSGSAPTWQAVAHKLPARYRYGVTATLDRGDGMDVAARLYLGPTRHVITQADMAAGGGLIIPRLVVIRLPGRSAVWDAQIKERERWEASGRRFREPRIDYNALMADLLGNPDRNAKIIWNIITNADGHATLVLTDRIEHCQALYNLLSGCPGLAGRARVFHGGLAKAARADILAAARDGEVDVLIAADLANEGLDLPRLDRLHLVAGGRNAALLKQRIGRLMRPAPGKADAVVFDYVDVEIGILQTQYYARCKVYRELGMMAPRTQRRAG